MKIIFFFVLSFWTRKCKRKLLMGVDLHGLLVPTKSNPLCPEVSFNCCTDQDLVIMYKVQSKRTDIRLENHFKHAKYSLQNMKKFTEMKSKLFLKKLNEMFFQEKGIHDLKFFKHMNVLSEEFDILDWNILAKDIINLTKVQYPYMMGVVQRFRQSVNCALCNYENHAFVNLKANTITYKKDFCLNMIDNILPILQQKYLGIVYAMVLFDEWNFLITGQRIIKKKKDLQKMNYYVKIVKKCSKNQTVFNCQDICSEFNLNSRSDLLEGEIESFDLYLKNFLPFFSEIVLDFKEYISNHDVGFFSKIRKKSILQTSIILGTKHKNTSFIKIDFSDNKKQQVIKKSFQGNDIQIETLQNEIDPLTLYQMREESKDISQLIIVYEENFGFDFQGDMKENNFDLPKKQILALIHSKTASAMQLDEILESDVIKTIINVNINDIHNFIADKTITFLEYKQLEKKKLQKRPEDLQPVGILSTMSQIVVGWFNQINNKMIDVNKVPQEVSLGGATNPEETAWRSIACLIASAPLSACISKLIAANTISQEE